jgi:hypothetical protein
MKITTTTREMNREMDRDAILEEVDRQVFLGEIVEIPGAGQLTPRGRTDLGRIITERLAHAEQRGREIEEDRRR